MNLNKVYLLGRLTQDPEMRSTSSGQNVASFSVATNRNWTDQSGQKQEQVEFHNIVVWRKLAEIAAQYLKKGQLILVEGRLQTRNWVGQDGVKRYRTEVVADNFQMGPKAGSSGSSNQAPVQATRPATPQAGPAKPAAAAEEIPVIQIEEEPSLGASTESDESDVVPF